MNQQTLGYILRGTTYVDPFITYTGTIAAKCIGYWDSKSKNIGISYLLSTRLTTNGEVGLSIPTVYARKLILHLTVNMIITVFTYSHVVLWETIYL